MRKISTASFFLLLLAAGVCAQGLYGNFIGAYTGGDYQNCIKHGSQLASFTNDPETLYKLSQCYSEAGQTTESLKILDRLADLGLSYKISAEKRLQKLKNEKDYRKLLAKFEKNSRPVNRSRDAFTLGDSNLIPEGIAALPDGSRFFVGSVAKNKIVEYSQPRGEKDFIASSKDGVWSILGMKVSRDASELWVCSFAERGEFAGYAGVFGFDVGSGKLLAKYVSDNRAGQHLFNDLVISASGRIYLTDSKAGKVLALNRATGQFESNFDRDFIYPNGIALDEKSNALFVADFNGITKIDLKTKRITAIDAAGLTYLNSVDGLYFYEGSLVAVQNTGDSADRIARFFLDESQTRLAGVKILQSFDPDFNVPTTGTIAGDDFYYIANSYVTSIKPDGTIADADQLKKPLIKKINLKAASK